MSIQLTDNAAQRVKHFLEKEDGIALRLGVRKTGCSGWAYEVSIASELGRPLGEVVRRARELNLWDEYSAKKLSELKTTMLPKDGSKCLCGADMPRDGRFCSSCGRPIR